MLTQSKLVRLRHDHRLLLPTFSSRRRRCHSDSPSPSPQNDVESTTVTQVVELLQLPTNQWDFNQLRPFLLHSSHRLPEIALRLNSIPKALDFLNYLTDKTEYPHQALSYAFQGALQLATRHPNSQNELLMLYSYRNSNGANIALTAKSAYLLLQCLCKAQMLDDSLLLFNELYPSSISSRFCNDLLKGLFKSGRTEDALHVLDKMLEGDSDFPPDDFTGEVVFGELGRQERRGRDFAGEEILGLVTKLCEHGVFPDAFKLTQMITALCRNRKNGVAWELLQGMMRLGGAVAVEAASCNALLAGLGRERDIQRMNKLMAQMEEMRIKPSVVTFGILVNHLCKARRIDEALEVFDKLRDKGEGNNRVGVDPDVILFNTLIDGLCKAGRVEHGLSLLEEMKTKKQSQPNAITYNCLIDGFCKAGKVGKARQLFQEMTEEGVKPTVVTLNTLVDGLCKHGKVQSAVEFFNEMKGKGLKGNTVTYTTLISAFCGVNNIDKAMQYFDEMLSSGCSSDAIVYYSLISGLSIAGRMDDASVIVSKLKQAGFGLDRACYNVLISGFCKKKKLERVYEMLNEMDQTGVKPDIVTYNTLVSYFGKIGDFATAGKLMKRMIKEGLEPSVVTYGTIIHAYCLKENVDEAMKIFEEMCSTSKVPPNTVIYNILIDALCKNNNVEKAVSLMNDMKIKEVRPNTTTYNAIFKGVRDKRMLQKAFELMNRMIEDACSPDYITMEILTEWLDAVGELEKLKCFVQGHPVPSPASSQTSICLQYA